MAIQTLKTIKNWFRTGLKPTQTQFWDTWDSFRHKNQKVPVADIEDIDELLSSKTDKSDFKTINGESILGSGDIGIDGGGSQNLQQTLETGDIAQFEGGNSRVKLLNGDPDSRTIELVTGDTSIKSSLLLGNTFASLSHSEPAPGHVHSNISATNAGIILSNNDNGTNAWSNTLKVPYNTTSQTTYSLPIDRPNGNYTLATLDDIITPTLQEIFTQSKSEEGTAVVASINNGTGSSSILNFYANSGDIAHALIVNNNTVNGDTASVGGEDGLVNIAQFHSGYVSRLSFEQPIAGGYGAKFKIPAKPEGNYTLATTSDLTSLSSGAITYSPVTPSALIRSERTAANYIATPGVNSTDLSISNQATGVNGTKGTNSVSMGFNNRTDGTQSITIGTINYASSIDDIVIGAGNSTAGGYGIAVGCSNISNVNVSGAFGDSNTINGSGYSSGVYAIGRDNKVVATSGGGHMIAGLYNNVTSGAWSSVFGISNSGTTGMLSTVIGVGNNAPSFLETVIGTYATSYTPVSASAVDLTDRLFTIGNGIDNTNRSNALVMLKSGVTTLPTVTNTLIKAEPTGKVLITKEYLSTTGFTVNGTLIPLGGSMTFTAPTQLTTTSKLTSAFSNSTTTRNTVSSWTFAVTAGKTYKIEIIGAYQTAALTTGGSIGFILTGGGTGSIMGKMDGEILQTTVNTGVRTTIRAINDINTTAGSFMTTTGVGVINSPHYIGGILNFSCTTSGTFEVQFGSEVALSAAQLNAGSLLLVTEY